MHSRHFNTADKCITYIQSNFYAFDLLHKDKKDLDLTNLLKEKTYSSKIIIHIFYCRVFLCFLVCMSFYSVNTSCLTLNCFFAFLDINFYI